MTIAARQTASEDKERREHRQIARDRRRNRRASRRRSRRDNARAAAYWSRGGFGGAQRPRRCGCCLGHSPERRPCTAQRRRVPVRAAAVDDAASAALARSAAARPARAAATARLSYPARKTAAALPTLASSVATTANPSRRDALWPELVVLDELTTRRRLDRGDEVGVRRRLADESHRRRAHRRLAAQVPPVLRERLRSTLSQRCERGRHPAPRRRPLPCGVRKLLRVGAGGRRRLHPQSDHPRLGRRAVDDDPPRLPASRQRRRASRRRANHRRSQTRIPRRSSAT